MRPALPAQAARAASGCSLVTIPLRSCDIGYGTSAYGAAMLADPSSAKARVLVVEDEADLGRSLAYGLEATGYVVALAESGAEALRLASAFDPNVVLLDLMLPDMPGFDVCRQIRLRASERQPAIIILTACTQEADRVSGFEAGADDYVVKPFSVRELMLRIETRLKARQGATAARAASPSGSAPEPERRVVVGTLELDRDGHRLFVSGQEIRMSAQEMRLLLYLADPPGRMRTRRELLTEVWGYHPDVTSRTLDTHVKRIRDKLGHAGRFLQTQRGIGYRLADTQRRRAVARVQSPDAPAESASPDQFPG